MERCRYLRKKWYRVQASFLRNRSLELQRREAQFGLVRLSFSLSLSKSLYFSVIEANYVGGS